MSDHDLPYSAAMAPDTPTPGTPEAIAAGCICDYRDGDPLESERWPDWLVRGCPLHDPMAAVRGPA